MNRGNADRRTRRRHTGEDSTGTGSEPPQPTDTYAPLVVAHRGASEALAEHTLGAYKLAISQGADALECDVRLTRDGHLVCVHDRRVERTSNGRGVVSEFALDELNALDFASWHPPAGAADPDARVPDQAEPVLSFATLLGLIRDAGRPLRLLVETKHPTRYGGLVEQALVAELRRFGMADPPDPDAAPVTMMSFSQLAVRRVGDLAPRLPTVLLLNGIPLWLRNGVLPTGVRIAGPGIATVRDQPQFVARAHEAGNRVYVWTVNQPADVDLVTGLRVDGIITDRPGYVRERLGR